MSDSGSRFKEIRTQLRLSQEEMGKILNTTKSYISLVEKGKCRLSAESLEKLLINYNVNLNYLIGGIGRFFINQENDDIKNDILSELEEIIKAKRKL